ncbi:MAG TPA: PAS domain S-box protein [Myxococcaceae bacterium]|nr:PAS domain S-box protein [Myxococcaceae bacterium]
MNHVSNDRFRKEVQETAAGRADESRAGDEGMVALLDELEGASHEGFAVFRGVRGPHGELTGFRCLYVNPAARRLLGGEEVPMDELLGAMRTDSGATMFGSFARTVQTGQVYQGRVRGGVGGEDRWFQGVLTPFRDGVTVRFEAVEEETLARESLPRELVHRLLSGAGDDVLWDWDLLSGQLAWGDSVQRVFGYDADELRGALSQLLDRLHPEDRDRVAVGLCAAIQGERDVWSDAFRLRRADGSHAFVLGRGFLVRNRVGKPLRMLGSMVDLTERVRGGPREGEEKFRATFDQAAVGIALLAPSGAWLQVNGKLREVLGYPDEEALEGLTLHALVHPEELPRLQRRLGRMVAGESRGETWELRLRGRDGRFRWFRLALSAAHEARGEPRWLVAVAEDIDDRKRWQSEAHRALEFDTRLYGMMGHDLRSPLAALKATVSGLLSRPEKISEPQRKALARIARSTHRIHRLVEELLDYTRVRLGEEVTLHPRQVDAHALCEGLVDDFAHAHPGRVSFCDTPLDARAFWDADRVRQLLEGLLDHAVIHADHHQPVWLLLGGDEDALTFTVRYDGEPIPSEQLDRLFEPFSDGEGLDPTVKLSQGLGLYLAREMARAHGGSMTVESTPEGETAFVVTLPRFQVSAEQTARH